DHLASLPIFLDNVYTGNEDCVTVYGTEPVLDCLRKDVFNDRLWPDLVTLSGQGRPFLKLHLLEPGRTVIVEGLSLTPVPVQHAVPTVGFLVSDEQSTVVIPSDTSPTHEIWERAREAKNLKAVFLEATFPKKMAWLAELAQHLTPELFAQEAAKAPAGV